MPQRYLRNLGRNLEDGPVLPYHGHAGTSPDHLARLVLTLPLRVRRVFSTDVQPSSPPPAPSSRSIAWSITKVLLVLLEVLASHTCCSWRRTARTSRAVMTVLGVDIVGQSVPDATTTLQRELADDGGSDHRGGSRTLIDAVPAQAGLSLDACHRAIRRGEHVEPDRLVHGVFCVSPGRADRGRRRRRLAQLAGIATQVDQAVVEGAVDFKAQAS